MGAPVETIPKTSEQLIVTVQQHILLEQRRRFPQASGAFSWLLSGITLATKMIQAQVRRAGLLDVLGTVGRTNIQGETQQKLDVYANQALLHCLSVREDIAVLASEENDEPVTLQGQLDTGRYIVVFDPLDGSSNIDVNVSVGTVFAILSKPDNISSNDPAEAVLQPGVKQLAAGYVLYGSSTMLVYTTGHGVHSFTLDPEIGAFLLSHENIRMPDSGSIYSVNESHFDAFAPHYQEHIRRLRRGHFGRSYTSRYVGSLVADFHRTLLKGGIFMYPPTASHPDGKLRLMYEANPIAFIAEQAGGRATNGQDRMLEVQPNDIHQRVPLVVGGRDEMDAFEQTRRELHEVQ
jgi:fructose-1,6-bisphosphatase I